MYQIVEGWLWTSGRVFVNEDGNEVLLRGLGVANWLNPEGFLFGGAPFGGVMGRYARSGEFDRGRTMDLFITELCGASYQKKFWEQWVERYFAEDDIRAIKEQGFNSVRLPLDARLILNEEPGYHFNEEHLQMLDHYIDLCEKYRLYVIIDLHAACAGQSAVSCDNGVDNQPHLFFDEEGAERTIRLWEKLASRWAERWIIAGYDILNEPIALPMFDYLLPELKKFYDRAVSAIRAVDRRHILFIQGNRFAGRLDIFDHDYDPICHNWAITMHCYETFPDLALFGPILAKSEECNVPVWMGECGGSDPSHPEVGNAWMTAFFEMLMEYHISYNIWCTKALEGVDAAYTFSFQKPNQEMWQQIVDYCGKGGVKPGYAKAIAVFDELLENIRFENCTEQRDRVAAMLRRPGIAVPASAYDADMEHRGSWPYALFCGYRREDRMHLIYEPGYVPNDLGGLAAMNPHPVKYGDWPHIWLQLDEGDAASYSIREVEKPVSVRLLACGEANAKIRVSSEGSILYEGCVPEGVKPEPLDVGTTAVGERVTIRLEALCGSVTLKEIAFLR
ncbi:MAG: glycoside hydrolase family 5 protein [Clostridiales bacterium]|nr:glycoside hydrolase family 5 protein [Clostridiales bacterium]